MFRFILCLKSATYHSALKLRPAYCPATAHMHIIANVMPIDFSLGYLDLQRYQPIFPLGIPQKLRSYSHVFNIGIVFLVLCTEFCHPFVITACFGIKDFIGSHCFYGTRPQHLQNYLLLYVEMKELGVYYYS